MKAATALATAAAIKTILFPTDFSDASKRAQSYAAGFANRFRAKLLILHAKEPRNYSLPPETWRAQEDAESSQNAGTAEVALPIHSLSCRANSVEVKEPHGKLWKSALEQKNTVDMIVLGTRGRTGVGKLLLGSHAEEIFRRATCPVLTVGPHVKDITGWRKGT